VITPTLSWLKLKALCRHINLICFFAYPPYRETKKEAGSRWLGSDDRTRDTLAKCKAISRKTAIVFPKVLG
jgi:hypothetical protein